MVSQHHTQSGVDLRNYNLVRDCATHQPPYPKHLQMAESIRVVEKLFSESLPRGARVQDHDEMKKANFQGALPESLSRALLEGIHYHFNDGPYTFEDLRKLLGVHKWKFDELVVTEKGAAVAMHNPAPRRAPIAVVVSPPSPKRTVMAAYTERDFRRDDRRSDQPYSRGRDGNRDSGPRYNQSNDRNDRRERRDGPYPFPNPATLRGKHPAPTIGPSWTVHCCDNREFQVPRDVPERKRSYKVVQGMSNSFWSGRHTKEEAEKITEVDCACLLCHSKSHKVYGCPETSKHFFERGDFFFYPTEALGA